MILRDLGLFWCRCCVSPFELLLCVTSFQVQRPWPHWSQGPCKSLVCPVQSDLWWIIVHHLCTVAVGFNGSVLVKVAAAGCRSCVFPTSSLCAHRRFPFFLPFIFVKRELSTRIRAGVRRIAQSMIESIYTVREMDATQSPCARLDVCAALAFTFIHLPRDGRAW